MHSQRCEPQQIYKKVSLLGPNNFFFLTRYFGKTFDLQKVELVCLYIFHKFSVFQNAL